VLEPWTTLICDADATNKDCTVKDMVETKVDCFPGKDTKTGAAISKTSEQYEIEHTGSAGGLLEIKGAFAMKPPGSPRQKVL
jgi:hypothetical protein